MAASIVALFAPPAQAQIVDVQRLLAGDPPEGLAGGVDGSVDVRRGDVELTILSGSVNARWRRDNLAVFALIQGERASTADGAYLEKDLEHLRFRFLGGALQAETFFQHDRDRFRRRELRALWGVGPRAILHASTRSSLAAGLAGMAELERLSSGPYADSGRSSIHTRASLYLSGRHKLDDALAAGQTVYLQPRADDAHDVRALSESELVVTLGPRLSLRFTASIAHESNPPDGVQRTQTAIKTAFHLDLGGKP